MPVTAISYQPNVSQLLAAYRPIRFVVTASTASGKPVPPYVFCDIYIADKYYKSQVRTTPAKIAANESSFEFDISDALQEYLQADIATITNRDVLAAVHSSAKVFCKFRASDTDADGFTVDEGIAPIQATTDSAAVPGTGYVSNSFYVINAALQHEDNQNIASHLNYYKTGNWNPNAYPLSHRKRYFFCPGDSDHFPFIFRGDCVNADLVLHYRLKGSQNFQTVIALDQNTCDPIGFDTNVILNKVIVTLSDPIPDGHYVFVRYKKQGTTQWIDHGNVTVQQFFFTLANMVDSRGLWDLQVIHFCTPCLSSAAVTQEFDMGEEGIPFETEWRGVDPYCVQDGYNPPIYVELSLRDPVEEEYYVPNNTVKNSKNNIFKAKLYAQFFSDPQFLNPVNVDIPDLKVYVKYTESVTLTTNVIFNTTDKYESELVSLFTTDALGSEALLGEVTTELRIENYASFPAGTVKSRSATLITFTPFPLAKLGFGAGLEGYATLKMYNKDTNIPVPGQVKPNAEDDPNYIAPAPSLNCPVGPEFLYVIYDGFLEIAKVEIKYDGHFVYAPTVVHTEAGGYRYVIPAPRNTKINIAVKAKTLDSGNATGFVHVRVQSAANNSWNSFTSDFTIPNNIETAIAQNFTNITEVRISNY